MNARDSRRPKVRRTSRTPRTRVAKTGGGGTWPCLLVAAVPVALAGVAGVITAVNR